MALQSLIKSWRIGTAFWALLVMMVSVLCAPGGLKAQWVEPDSLSTIRQLKQSFVAGQFDNEEVVIVSGIANTSTGTLHENYLQTYIQNDATGLSIFSYGIDAPIAVGDSVVVKGRRQMYFGQPELLVTDYRVYSRHDTVPNPVNVFEAFNTPGRYTGMLVEGTGIVQAKGTRFNGKYLTIARSDTSDQGVMVYVSNFHAQYQDFDFATPSIGDAVSIKGVLGQYDPADPESRAYKVFLRTPDDISYASWPRYYLEIVAFILVALVGIAVIWMLSLRRQVKRKTHALQQSLAEKEMLLKEIHHRVKNNLASISGLLELQSGATDSEEVRTALQESQARIVSMGMVHEKLYQSTSLKDVTLERYLEDLSANIAATIANGSTNIDIEIRCDDIKLPTDQIIPLGLLVNELLVNVFKHAFREQKNGEVLIEVLKNSNIIKLKVEDSGVGLPDDIHSRESETLGMLLINTFSEQLGAKKTIKNTRGACFVFKFPMHDNEQS